MPVKSTFFFDIHAFTVTSTFSLPSSVAVGSKSGYKLFSLNSVEKLEEIYEYGKCCVFCVYGTYAKLNP